MNEGWDGINRRDATITERWFTPSAVMVVVGGIVWGVQLNVAVQTLTADVATIETENSVVETNVNKLSAEMVRVSLILEQLESRMSKEENK